jgi:xanthine dehydrogenase YagR molybdenum-binding subunit
MLVRRTLATMFGLAEENVRVLAPYIGVGFDAGLRAWPHLMLIALTARVGRVLLSPQKN